MINLFLAGDVMTGRGIDQILPHSGDATLYESHVRSAVDYVALAEGASGPVPRPVRWDYVWGDALAVVDRQAPDVRIVNLETAITARGSPAPKGINYRMHPGNVAVLTAARLDACVLANNHVLDWGEVGLLDTLETLHQAGLGVAGAGRSELQAAAPLMVPVQGRGRVIVLAFGCASSGIPQAWAAHGARPGVNMLPDLSASAITAIAARVRATRRQGDIVVASIHWGGNWGYEIPAEHRSFAHALIDDAGADLVHGHSSHHAIGIEVYRGKLVLYGCGDFINDYEGIGGYEQFRPDLVLAYFPQVRPENGALAALEMVPFQVRRLHLLRASSEAAGWMAAALSREGARLGTHVDVTSQSTLRLSWS